MITIPMPCSSHRANTSSAPKRNRRSWCVTTNRRICRLGTGSHSRCRPCCRWFRPDPNTATRGQGGCSVRHRRAWEWAAAALRTGRRTRTSAWVAVWKQEVKVLRTGLLQRLGGSRLSQVNGGAVAKAATVATLRERNRTPATCHITSRCSAKVSDRLGAPAFRSAVAFQRGLLPVRIRLPVGTGHARMAQCRRGFVGRAKQVRHSIIVRAGTRLPRLQQLARALPLPQRARPDTQHPRRFANPNQARSAIHGRKSNTRQY